MAAARDQRGGAGRRPDTLSIIVAFVGNEMSQLPCCLNLRSVGEEGGVGSPLVKTWEIGKCVMDKLILCSSHFASGGKR